jgi:hypothetical protein
MQVNYVIFAVALLLAPVALSLWRRREGIGHWVRRKTTVLLIYAGVIALAAQFMHPLAAIVIGFSAALAIDALYPRRSRYVRKAHRDEAIRRHFKKTGERYSRRKHDFGHLVAFSSGGSNTVDNIRVQRRRENRSRGARGPWWDVFGR